jgi:hypothetical protein
MILQDVVSEGMLHVYMRVTFCDHYRICSLTIECVLFLDVVSEEMLHVYMRVTSQVRKSGLFIGTPSVTTIECVLLL